MKHVTSKQAAKCIKKRDPGSFKGQNGKVLVIGGNDDLIGAPALAAQSALAVLRSQTDLVTVLAPKKCGFVINTYSPDLIVKKVDGKFFSERHLKIALENAEKADAVLIGPGLGLNEQTKKFVKKFAEKNHKPLVVDADAIKALAGHRFSHKAIITPHQKELEIFCGKKIGAKKELTAKETAKKYNCVVLLKGRIDIISDGNIAFYNRTGNAGMTVGGTGDVLAGFCAAFAAKGTKLLDAAVCAAYINGLVGNCLKKKFGYGFIASDF
ncbi:MAG: NAD(P)H-hydrate dehydratase, partial [archaeon]